MLAGMCMCRQETMIYLFVALEKDDAATLVTSCKIIAGVIEFHRGDDISYALRQSEVQTRRVNRKHAPSVMSSTSPLSPKHWAKRHWLCGVASVSMPGKSASVSRRSTEWLHCQLEK